MHYVTAATHLGGYRLWLRFEDRTEKTVDLQPHLDGGIFEPLQDAAYFAKVRFCPDIDTVVWPNGADFSPDFLYKIGVDAGICRLPAD